MEQTRVIVIGGLNTDIVAVGVNKLLKAGEHTYGQSLKIGPGGKSRNIAQMTSVLAGKKMVAMIGKTSKDPYELWKPPVDSLKNAGVDVSNIQILSYEKTKKFPGIALIAVDKNGSNQIYVLPGITDDFLQDDIEKAEKVFDSVGKNNGFIILTLEMPLSTVIYSIKKANQKNIKVILDPGGIVENENYKELLKQKIFLIKPNEHEVFTLTGIKINNFLSIKKAAAKLFDLGIENVFITFGKKGGYLFNKSLQLHIPVPKIKESQIQDETGCGDQTIAAFASELLDGKDLEHAATVAIRAGTLQFGKSGIIPIERKELYPK